MSGTQTGQTIFDGAIRCVTGGGDPLEYLAELVDLTHSNRASVEQARYRLRSLVLLEPTDGLGLRALGLVDEALRLASR
jgi:hypothetical protein